VSSVPILRRVLGLLCKVAMITSSWQPHVRLDVMVAVLEDALGLSRDPSELKALTMAAA